MIIEQLSILIADDDDGDRKAIRRALEKSDISCAISEVTDAGTALEAIRQHPYSCAILDYRMPGQDGLETLSEMIEISPYLVVVMVTGEGDEEVAAEAFRRGASDYIPKNVINSETISRVLHNAVEKMAFKKLTDEQRAELAKFARVLAHDLKEPARTISNFCNRIEKNLDSNGNEKLATYLAFVTDASRRMGKLIDTLANYTRLDLSPPQISRIDSSTVVANAVSNLHVLTAENNARIVVEDLPKISGDAAQLTQLFQNLISNAIKFCRETTPEIIVSVREEESHWQFAVKDNGIGIEKEFQAAVFEPFRRLHSRNDYAGTGLGLNICDKIVKRHNGKIWCESEFGVGSTFHFTISKS